jgi:hypothetical protein
MIFGRRAAHASECGRPERQRYDGRRINFFGKREGFYGFDDVKKTAVAPQARIPHILDPSVMVERQLINGEDGPHPSVMKDSRSLAE